MQNRYVGDLGDFGKYGLLNALSLSNGLDDGSPLSLGVVWYLVRDESHNDDGKHIRYLEPSARNFGTYRKCDPLLYDSLRRIVSCGPRAVRRIRDDQILPAGTVYYEVPLTFGGINGTGRDSHGRRLTHRCQWVRDALTFTAQCDIVFVDPDNGLEVKVKRHQKHGPKYAFFDELLPYLGRDQSLVIYHHIGRSGSAEEQIKARLNQIKERLEPDRDPIALWYHRGSARAFFIIPNRHHAEVLTSRITKFAQSPWFHHFQLIRPNLSPSGLLCMPEDHETRNNRTARQMTCHLPK